MPHDSQQCFSCGWTFDEVPAGAGESETIEIGHEAWVVCGKCAAFTRGVLRKARASITSDLLAEVADAIGEDAQDIGSVADIARSWQKLEGTLEQIRKIGREDASDLAEARRELQVLRNDLFAARQRLASAESRVARLEQMVRDDS
ncbi:MAG: hypothetical protein KC457_00965 [Myxococcales bacterium]|nr:hypothetical protein [Myxococcales bacterium]